MEDNTVKKNYIYNMIYQVVLIILPIITTPYLARVLGSEGNGTFGYTVSIVTYFILFGSLGISLYGQREIAYNQKDIKNRSSVLFELLIIRTITILISSLVFYFLFCLSSDYSLYYKILLLELFSTIIDISWFYQGMEDFKKIVLRNLTVKLISVLLIFIFIKNYDDLYKYFIIYTSSTLFGSLSLWFGIKKYIVRPNKLRIKRHVPLIISLFIPQIAIQIYTVLDKTMLGTILNDMSEVGYYEQSQKIVKILLAVITSISLVMMPRIASNYKDGNIKKIKEYMNSTFKFIFFLSFPLMFGIMAVSNNFVPLFFGKGYDKVIIILRIICIIIPFISISSVIGTQYLLALKKQKEYTISVIIGALINLILNFLLISNYNSIGASIATVFAELFVTIIQFYFIRKDFNLKEIFKSLLKYFLVSLIMFIICFIPNYFITSRIICLLVQVIIGIITYFSILIIIKDDFFMNTLKSFLKKFKKQ